MWDNLYIEELYGNEGGVVVKDEEYRNSCRITLEKCLEYYAITCGVYGAMVHTVFCDFDKGLETYEAMKRELQDFIDKDTIEDEKFDFYKNFISKY